jgi:hypothetical protein
VIPGRDRTAVPDGSLVFAAAITVYLWSAPRGVMLDDDGSFIIAAWFNGVAHAPGYPLYTQLAHIATLMPAGSVAFRVHALSALCGAMAVLCLWTCARRLGLVRSAAAAAALAFAFSDVFWSQSIVAEVYSLNALFIFALLALAMRPGATPNGPDSPVQVRISAFLYGLSLSNHWPLTLLAAPALLAAMWPRRTDILRNLPSAVVFCLLGLTPYIWMICRSWSSEIAFYGPIANPGDFWYYVSRAGYSEVDASQAAGLDDKLDFALFVLREAALQFGPLAAPFILIGFARQWRCWPRNLSLALVLAFLCSSMLLIALLGFSYDLRYQSVFRVYPIVAYGVCAIWLGLGLQEAAAWLARRFGGRARRPFLAMGLSGLAVAGALLWNAPANYHARDTWAGEYARAVLESLPGNAAFFIHGDFALGSLGYLNRVEGVRRDVTLYHHQGLVFDTRLFPAYTPDPKDVRNAVDRLIVSGSRPVFYEVALDHSYGVVDYGLYSAVDRSRPRPARRIVLDRRIGGFLEALLSRGPPRDRSELLHFRQLSSMYCGLLASLGESAATPDKQLEQAIEERCADYQGLLQRAGAALGAGSTGVERALLLLSRAERHSGEAPTVESLSLLEYLRGRAFLAAGDEANARVHFERSLAILPGTANASFRYVPDYGSDAGN